MKSRIGHSLNRKIMFVVCALLPVLAVAETLPDSPHVVVSAHGEAEALPDIARLQLQISETRNTAVDAKSRVDERTARVLTAMREQGVPDTDIRASQIRIYPDYEWQDGKRLLRGQRVERSIDLTLNELNRYGAVLDALVQAGITELGNVSFDVSNRDELMAQALQAAMADANAKAATLAAGFGRRLAGVYHIDEGASAPIRQERMVMMDAKMSAAPMLLGKETVSANLNVVFLLK
ncbi:26 kDa periplasmic immunogenic protein [Zhongshania aliphaticivorans]|uniref:26 kDa periplasmic immunogenic protein n=1 Tax=Zhongshania aliphaticivorans TaxID=1470434 RepID=A0A5S9MPW4_9GAMM|nr:SIMPL domain-containing protein [Zhongshania aliphaticivorans]CAA0079039.1 26 kDa periplasmic immunogenic protein [Zhongshania aliphaticivorans]CAA0086392.1 26 kDa periplasmic immunogenic protein [Zhongshania aliphaticivorans]